jgi:cytochrome c peroxidase
MKFVTHRGLVWMAVFGLLAWQSPEKRAAAPMTREAAVERARALATVGRKMFFDASLSQSGRFSCATCHDPRYAYGPPNGLALQRGFRAAPSLRYLQAVPEFTEHYFDSEGFDPSIDNGATGGLTWDGRVDRQRDQARIPLLSAREMANASPAAVVSKVRESAYREEFEKVAGARDPFATILEALEAWQQDEREFYPYSSKYDEWLAGRVQLSAQEALGLQLFDDPAKGGCTRCHIAARGTNGTPPQFTDYGFIALGVPRNPQIAANRDASWFDLGLCGPERTDLQSHAEYCGQFRTPTLRNVALRDAFFHNGAVHSLRDAVSFYATRDTQPERWYPRGKFDDLPARYAGNVEKGAPFGAVRALSESEIDAVVAFLRTLTDGFSPQRH